MEAFERAHKLKPLVDGWEEKIHLGEKFKRPWADVAEECMMFFSAATGFLWDAKYAHKFVSSENPALVPDVKITIAKPFELVSIMGPMLFWRNPVRNASPRKPIELPAELLAMRLGLDPQAAAAIEQTQAQGQPIPPEFHSQLRPFSAYQQITAENGRRNRRDQLERELRAGLMGRYLNFTPWELKLHRHSEMALIEAMVKGRGVLWPQPYRPPGSNRLMVGSFYDTVDHLLIDPDAESGDFEDAWWIAQECVEPVWKVERDRGYRPGELKHAANLESANSQGERWSDPKTDNARAMGQTQDLLRYHKIWSRCGIGARLTGVATDLKDRLETVCGDYCYIEVANSCPFPLNFSSDQLATATVDEVRRAFRWPTPHWRDGKFPPAVLDFYSKPRSPWPMPPMAPALGELKALNFIVGHACARTFSTCRDMIAVPAAIAETVEKAFKMSGQTVFVRIDEQMGDISKAVAHIQMPTMSLDLWKVAEMLIRMIEERTGLNEAVLGVQGKMARSATDAQFRQQNISHRPQHMAAKVEEWQTEAALREALAVRWWIRGQDVADLLGPLGAELWEEYIVNTDVERTIRDIDYRIEAGSARKPNRERDVANLNEAIPIFVPLLQQYAQATGNFEPLNWLIERWGKTAEMDIEGMKMRSLPPPSPAGEEQAQAAAQEQQIETAKFQAEQGRKAGEHQQAMQQREEKHRQDVRLKEVQANLKAALARRNGNRAGGR